ncbi:MAG: TonB-dependent receptor [Bacteroidota bacterium]
MFKICLGLVLCCSSWNVLLAQVDTSLTLPEYELNATSLRQVTTGTQTQIWDAKAIAHTNANTVAELLEREGNVYIKNYGLGSLSTSSIRGGSAGQTLVLWNGLPVHSPMLGLLDLSLLPTLLMEDIYLQKGGNSSAWGSGAVGGLIALNNSSIRDSSTSIQVHLRGGSFGQQQYSSKVTLPLGRFRLTSRWSDQQANNDFEFQAAPTLPVSRQTNARFRQRHWLSSLQYQLARRHLLTFDAWHQSAHRQIPPTLTQTRSEAKQYDHANRFSLSWQHLNNRSKWQAKTALFQEHLRFSDPLMLLIADSEFQTWFNEATLDQYWSSRQRSTFGATHSRTQATADGYVDGRTEQRFAIWSLHQYNMDRWQAQLNIRQGWIDGQRVPITPSLSMNYAVSNTWSSTAKVSRNYRLPTLNDRFWQPGGNPDLQAEEGWSQEIIVKGIGEIGRTNWQWNTAIFNRNIRNWILWTPLEGQAFWSANNIAAVWSRGLEQSLQLDWQSDEDWQWQLRFDYTYLKSTNQIALERPKIQEGVQLIYTPEHQAATTCQLRWKTWQVRYQHQHTANIRGVNDDLPAFQTAQASLQYTTTWAANRIRLFTQIYNIWDADYLIVERRPMPRRHFALGIQYNYH